MFRATNHPSSEAQKLSLQPLVLHRFLVASRCGRQPKTYVQPEAAITVFELLMMGGVSPETCWTIKKHWSNKFYYTVASYWLFLLILYYDALIHEHQPLNLLAFFSTQYLERSINHEALHYAFFFQSSLTSSLLGPNIFVYTCSRNASSYIISRPQK